MRAGVGPFVLAYPSGAATITDMGEIVAMIFSRRNPVFLKRSRNSGGWVTGPFAAVGTEEHHEIQVLHIDAFG